MARLRHGIRCPGIGGLGKVLTLGHLKYKNTKMILLLTNRGFVSGTGRLGAFWRIVSTAAQLFPRPFLLRKGVRSSLCPGELGITEH